MFLYNNQTGNSHHIQLYKGEREAKSKINSILGAGLITSRRNKRKQKTKNKTVQLVRKNIGFLKSLGFKIKKK